MRANTVQRLRLLFAKNGPARFISHLDLARALERSLTRAAIPVAYGHGFNRRPRMQFAAPLPLGVTGERELADIWLTEQMRSEQVLEQLNAKIAPGIFVKEVTTVALGEAALQTQTTSASYEATLQAAVPRGDLESRIEKLLDSQSHPIERRRGKKSKRFDIRPLILALGLEKWSPEQFDLSMHLSLLPGKTGRPDDVLVTIGLDPFSASIRRTEIRLSSRAESVP